jgi:hypothetical protein
MHSILRSLSVFGVLGLASSAFAAGPTAGPKTGVTSIPDPNSIYIENITANGTGCPAGTVAASITPDGSTMELTFSAFDASAGGGTPVSQERKNCAISFTLHVPGGLTYALAQADYNGFAQLDPGVTATEKTTYYIAGSPATTATFSTVLTATTPTADGGNYVDGDNYSRTDQFGLASLVWAPCGVDSIAIVNSSVNVNNAATAGHTGYGYISLDEMDFGAAVVFHFNWQHC